MDSLLRAKHWQIFLFAFGIPWLLMIVIMGFGFADFFSMMKANPDPEDMAIVMSEFMSTTMLGVLPLTLLSTAVSYGWMYAVNQRIGPMAPPEYQPKQGWVTIAIVCIVLFTIFNMAVSAYMYKNMFASMTALGSAPAAFDNMGPMFMILYILSLLGSFVNLGLFVFVSYQLSRAVKGAELQRYIRSEESIGPFFAFFFLFIGIWFMQPIVNKLHEEGPGGGSSLDRSLLLD